MTSIILTTRKLTRTKKNSDRTIPLEQRTDLIGHLLRLMPSIFLPNTAHGVGEFLFNLCNRDSKLFCREIGYGNASGFLQNIGQLIPPPQMPLSKGSGKDREGGEGRRVINPITGAYELPFSSTVQGAPEKMDMTSEEKLVEAEKLYVLFDRMAKTGVMDVENPVEKARNLGQFQETSDEAEAKLARLNLQDEVDEREAEAEMKKWKQRTKM